MKYKKTFFIVLTTTILTATTLSQLTHKALAQSEENLQPEGATLEYILPDEDNSEHIPLFYSLIEINADGTINVTEALDYNFPYPRHGISRNIPLTKENLEGKKLLMTASNVYVFDENNNSYEFQNNSTKKQIDLKIGDPDNKIEGMHTYFIDYAVSGALTYFDEFDELYWNVTGNEWEVPITMAAADIIFPDGVNLEDVTVYCYTGEYGSPTSDCEYEIIDEHTLSIYTIPLTDSNYDLQPYEGFSIQVDFPKGHVATLYPTKNTPSLWLKIALIAGMIILSITHFVWPITVLLENIEEAHVKDAEKRVVAAWFDPPKTQKGRKLTAGEVGLLHDIKPDIRDITAELIQLAQKGYIKIIESESGILKKKDYLIAKMRDWNSSDELLKYEKKLLGAIFKDRETSLVDALSEMFSGAKTKDEKIEVAIKVSDLGLDPKFKTDIENIYKDISTQLVNDGLLHENIYKTREKWILRTVLSGLFINPIMLIACIKGLKTIQKTNYGAVAAAEAHSLKNFLESQDKQLEFQAKNQMFFEKLLPFAVAFGVEKIWMKRFEDMQFKNPEWADVSDFSAMNYVGFVNSFNSSASRAYSASSNVSSSGFSGGGGGFSGGGGGGGGGGSW